MKERGLWLVLAAALAALALAAAGCGGGDESSSAETTVAAETTEPTTTEAATTEEAATETETDAAAGTIADKDCIELASAGAQFSQAFSATGQGANYAATAAFFEALANKAPDEIKADIKTLSTAWVKIAAALKGIDLSSGQVPSAETIAKLQKLSSTLDTPELQKATSHLEAWSKQHCGTSTP
jgi:hypothetical protein